jgi:uncharacterized damage-inducible protein DinB
MTAPWGSYARYSRLASETLYEACAALPHGERRCNLGAFFNSVHGTLNHLLPRDATRGTTRYLNSTGLVSEDPLDVLLPHFFNHQTHHRAQVHILLSQLGRAPLSLDLHRVVRPNPA